MSDDKMTRKRYYNRKAYYQDQRSYERIITPSTSNSIICFYSLNFFFTTSSVATAHVLTSMPASCPLQPTLQAYWCKNFRELISHADAYHPKDFFVIL